MSNGFKRARIVLSDTDDEPRSSAKSKPISSSRPRISSTDDESDLSPPSKKSSKRKPAAKKKPRGRWIYTGPPSPPKSASAHTSAPVSQIQDLRPHSGLYHSTDLVQSHSQNLLDWFSTVRETRGMPWRKPYDPTLSMKEKGQRAYEIWVSEVMLQQTQVNTVIPYWKRWMERWPTVADLATADIEEVNAAWQGLGYYRRARSLLEGAKVITSNIVKDKKDKPNITDYHGRLPDDVGVLERNIPGVGKYTAGAICSMAYGKKVPIVDGNINRLLSRLLARHNPSDSPILTSLLWAETTELLQKTPSLQVEGVAGDWNQALMELGSQICKPANPACGECPLSGGCKAFAETKALPPPPEWEDGEMRCLACAPVIRSELSPTNGPPKSISEVTIFPMKKASAKGPRDESTAVCILRWIADEDGDKVGDRWLFVKRPETGLLAGLFEPPSILITEPDTSPEERLAACTKYIQSNLLFDTPPLERLSIQSPSTYISTTTSTSTLPTLSPGNHFADYLHIFSHIRMTYHIHLFTITTPFDTPPRINKGLASTGQAVWVTKKGIGKLNVGTGVKKIWGMVYGRDSVWAGEEGEGEGVGIVPEKKQSGQVKVATKRKSVGQPDGQAPTTKVSKKTKVVEVKEKVTEIKETETETVTMVQGEGVGPSKMTERVVIKKVIRMPGMKMSGT